MAVGLRGAVLADYVFRMIKESKQAITDKLEGHTHLAQHP
jgi:hypothetical protein